MEDERPERPGPGSRSTLLKVVVLGDGGVGKSCLMNRFVSDQFDEHCFHTIGVEFMNKTLTVDDTHYTLQVWDTAGQERFKSLRTPFYRGSDICILAYAVDDRTSFSNVKMWMNEFLGYTDVRNGIDCFPFIVVGNKLDVPSNEKEVSYEQLKEFCEENKISTYIETSAKNAYNVVEAFSLAVKRWSELEQRADRELRAMEHTDALHLTSGTDSSPYRLSCCGRQ